MLQHLRNMSLGAKIMLVLVTMVLSMAGSMLLGVAIAKLVFGVNPDQLQLTSTTVSPAIISALKVIQVISSFGIFILPALLFFALQTDRSQSLGLKTLDYQQFIITPFIIFTCLPIINLTAEWNEAIHFPDWLAALETWIRSSEANAASLTQTFLKMESKQDLWINILMIAAIPAIGEELLFRGVLQHVFVKRLGIHGGIWLAAILFSAFHAQFLGFIPRMILGALLGYLFVWGKSIWYPILAHFTNNAMAVYTSYLIQKKEVNPEVEHIGAHQDEALIVVIAVLLLGAMLYGFYKRQMQLESEQQSA